MIDLRKKRFIPLIAIFILAIIISPTISYAEGEKNDNKTKLESFSGTFFLNANPETIEEGSTKDEIFKGRDEEFKFEKSISVVGALEANKLVLSESSEDEQSYKFSVPLSEEVLGQLQNCKKDINIINKDSEDISVSFANKSLNSPLKEIIIQKNPRDCSVNIEGIFVDKDTEGKDIKSGGSFELISSDLSLAEAKAAAENQIAQDASGVDIDLGDRSNPKNKKGSNEFVTIPSLNPDDKIVFQVRKDHLEDFKTNGASVSKMHIKLANLSEAIAAGDPKKPFISLVAYKVKNPEVLNKVQTGKALLEDGDSQQRWLTTSTHRVKRKNATAKVRLPLPPMESSSETLDIYGLSSLGSEVFGPVRLTRKTSDVVVQNLNREFPTVTRSETIKDKDLGFVISAVSQRIISSQPGGAVVRNPNGTVELIAPERKAKFIRRSKKTQLLLQDAGLEAVADIRGNLIFSGTLDDRDEFDNEEAGTVYISTNTREIFVKQEAEADWLKVGSVGAAVVGSAPGPAGPAGQSVQGRNNFDPTLNYEIGDIVFSPTFNSSFLAVNAVPAGLAEPDPALNADPVQNQFWMMLVSGAVAAPGNPAPPAPPPCGPTTDNLVLPADTSAVVADINLACANNPKLLVTHSRVIGPPAEITLNATNAWTNALISGTINIPIAPPASSAATRAEIPGYHIGGFCSPDGTCAFNVSEPFGPGSGIDTAIQVRVVEQ